jgi:hypothetical protein
VPDGMNMTTDDLLKQAETHVVYMVDDRLNDV